MKSKIVLVFILSLSLFLIGCLETGDLKYPYRQGVDQIEAIEILRKEYDSIRTDTPMYVIKTFDPSEFQMVLDGIDEVPLINPLNPNGTGFGLYIIRITYKNGEADLLGNYNTGFYTSDGELHQESYCFKTEPYYELISALLGEKVTWNTPYAPE